MFTKTKNWIEKSKKNLPKKEVVEDIKKIIKQEIARDVENKTSQDVNNAVGLWFPASTNYASANTFQMSPGSTGCNIQQGVMNGARVGNEIKIRKARVDMVFYPLGYDATSNVLPAPMDISLKLFYDKRFPTTFPTPAPDFFQFGSTSQAIIGDLRDHVAPINTDCYRVLASRTFKLGYASYNGSSSNTVTQFFNNNDYSLNKIIKWDITKYLVKNVKFNDNNVDPTTRGLWMQVIMSPANGIIGLNTTVPVRVFYNVYIDYEDA